MVARQSDRSVSRRAALAGLGAAGAGLALATTRGAAAQDAATEIAKHPVVGLWQYDGGFGTVPGAPDWCFSIYHADGTYLTWGGLNVGAALGLWRPTGERTGEVLFVWTDTDPFPDGVEGPGTAVFRFDLEVDEAGTTVTYMNGAIDARDPYGTPLFPPGPFEQGHATRVTFDANPATGGTATAPATPTASTPAT